MKSIRLAPLQAVVMFVLGLVVGGGLIGGAPQPAQATPDPLTTNGINGDCNKGDAVADFVCRNTWMATTKHNYR